MIEKNQVIELTAEIVAAHVANNSVAVNDVANLVQRVHAALAGLGQAPAEPEQPKKVPAVSVRTSVKPDYIVCLECGKRQRTLKRHLQTAHGVSPDQYRQDFGLPREYPLTAPNYSQQRQDMARRIGLGRKRAEGEAAPTAEKKQARRRRPVEEPAAE